MSHMQYYHKALTIAGSDSGGGAGIQADLKTFAANKVYGMSVITALTAQNTQEVRAIYPVPVEFLKNQMAAVMEDIGTDAVKIGMLHSSGVIRQVVSSLKKYGINNLVVDPVMVAASGAKLLEEEAIETLIREILPLATVITPNLPEAEIILNRKINTRKAFRQAAKDLAQTKASSILLKSGHFQADELIDILYIPEEDKLLEIPNQRINTANIHGTGCTLSSAIAANLAKGESLEKAIQKGLSYTHQAIVNGATYHIGNGNGPVHHFYQYWT